MMCIEDRLVCPLTKSELEISEKVARARDGSLYERVANGDYWDFLPEIEGTDWDVWNHLQANGQVSYREDPVNNLGVGERDDFKAFADFCQFHGLVLDVGCGPQKCPTHMGVRPVEETTFVGIDPLAGEQPRDFTFVRGLGEYLPFRTKTFDQVLFVTSLDHLIHPTVGLNEASRVTRNEICIWIGHKEKTAPVPSSSPSWYEGLSVPKGAEDPFHYRRLSDVKLESALACCGLSIVDKATIAVDTWRTNYYYRVKH